MTPPVDGRDPVALAQALIRCRSITPDEGGALALLGGVLAAAGFTVERPAFAAPGMPEIANLYAVIGGGGPILAFAGHTDVVPPGDTAAWRHDPFAAAIEGDVLYGRGAVDMKGGIAALAAAALRYLDSHPDRTGGTIAFLVTGDEEGAAVNGTRKLLEWAAARGARFDHCVLGEPTGVAALGDTLKIGRRGSLSAILTVHGRQGHVAYPERAENPIRALLPMLATLLAPLDAGTARFQPSNLEITSIDVGNAATNVIPASATARFNVRLNDAHTLEEIRELIAGRLAAAAGGARWNLDFVPGASAAFVTAPGPFLDLVSAAVSTVTGRQPDRSTGGGTSDARFIKDYCPVVELGLVGTTMHQIDERVPLAELEALTAIYEHVLKAYFG